MYKCYQVNFWPMLYLLQAGWFYISRSGVSKKDYSGYFRISITIAYSRIFIIDDSGT